MLRRLMVLRRLAGPLLLLTLLAPASAWATLGEAQIRGQLAGLHLPFIANQGQIDGEVAYYAPTFAGTMFVTQQGELVYSLPGRPAATPDASWGKPRASATPGWSLTETFDGGTVRAVGQDRSTTRVSHFLGNDPARWRTHAVTYDQISLGDVWPGVMVALRARGRSIEKVFTVSPGASVARIRVRVSGARALSVSADGALVARTGLGDVTFTTPVAYQERDGVRRNVTIAYRAQGTEYGFAVGAYDRTLPLVIDPLLQSTYLGGGGAENAFALAIHPATGDVYVAGSTQSTDFPGTIGGAQPTNGGAEDAFVARLSSSLTSLVQATYLGGSGNDSVRALAIHPVTGDVYVAGGTSSTNFPGTGGGAQPTSGGGGDAFVARLSSGLTALPQATYLGGSGNDYANALAIHPTTGDVYVSGSTFSADFPGTGGGAQPTLGFVQDAFVARLGSGLTAGALIQATYLGGSNYDASALAIHPTTGDVYVAGFFTTLLFPGDAFVARLNGNLTAIMQVTLLGDHVVGGPGSAASALAIHPTTGDVYVAGSTGVTNFPGVAGGAQSAFGGERDAFVARLNSALTALIQATYLGGGKADAASALVIHPINGDVYIAGSTGSLNFPGTGGAAQAANGGEDDAFVARLDSTLTLLIQATYLGGSRADAASAVVVLPTIGDVFVAGSTGSTDFPGTSGGAQPELAQTVFDPQPRDAFIARLTSSLALIDPLPGPDLTVTKVHTGTFFRGQVGATYTITARNVGTAATAGTVTVTDTPPGELTATALSGTGWTCTLGTLTCTRTDALASRSSYPAIILTVTVAAGAPSSVTNGATVSGGGDVNPANNAVADSTTILDPPDLTIEKTHSGNFFRGQVGATYTMLVTNVGTSATAGTVTVTDTLPTGLTATALSGVGWSCTLATLTCTRSDAVAGGSGSNIILTVDVAADAPSSLTNTATVSGGGDASPGNNTANDLTAVNAFVDVSPTDPFFAFINALVAAGITSGCATSPPQFCPVFDVTRGEMAVFLLRGIHGAGFDPPPATGTVFTDVPASHPFAKWIEQLALEGITGGCGPTTYCPDATVTRAEIAVFLLRAKHGAGFDPPPATGTVFTDVPASHPFAKWIEQIALEGITSGCGPTTYCPDAAVTRAEMAVFLVRTFNLPM